MKTEKNKLDKYGNILCLVCERPSIWTDKQGQKWTSPMINVWDGKIHRCCVRDYEANLKKTGGSLSVRIKK